MFKSLLLSLVAAGCIWGLTGCQTSPPPSEASQRGLTTIPWNRPAKWEGGGMLGSQMSAMRGY